MQDGAVPSVETERPRHLMGASRAGAGKTRRNGVGWLVKFARATHRHHLQELQIPR